MFRHLFSRRNPARRPAALPRLALEPLEGREVPAVVIRPIGIGGTLTIPDDKAVYIPVNVSGATADVATSVQLDNTAAGLSATLLQGGRSVQFTITGKDGSNQDFTGTITIRLFEDVAPLASQRIVDLINSNYYVNTGNTFHRVADLLDQNPAADPTNVIIQGGSSDGMGFDGSTLPDIDDEYDRDFTFASNGLVAFANAGDDGNNAQFFFTDLDRPFGQQVQFLNFNHTIFGIVTDGFDTLANMRATPLQPGTTTPVTPPTITAATVLASDPTNAVVVLRPTGTTFSGSVGLTITSTDNDTTDTEVITVTGAPDNINSRTFLDSFNTELTTTAGQPITFTLPAIDLDNDTITYSVRNASFANNTAPDNLSVQINQQTGVVTLTPQAGFTGTINFKVGARDQTQRASSNGVLLPLDDAGNYDTQAVRLTVNPAPPPVSPPPPDVFSVEGSASGSEARVTVRNADGSTRFSVLVFELGFTGGVRVARGDVTGDGKEDIVAVPGFGGASVFKVLDSNSGEVLFTRLMFEETFRGGLFVDVADARGLGYAQILVGAGESGGPRVTIYDIRNDVVLANFFAFDSETRGGVTVDFGEVVPARGFFLITGAGPGSGPIVTFFDPNTGAFIGRFLAGDTANRDGIRARAAEEINPATNTRDILVAPFRSTGTAGETAFDPNQFIDL